MAFTSSDMPSPPASSQLLKLVMSLDFTLANMSRRIVASGMGCEGSTALASVLSPAVWVLASSPVSMPDMS